MATSPSVDLAHVLARATDLRAGDGNLEVDLFEIRIDKRPYDGKSLRLGLQALCRLSITNRLLSLSQPASGLPTQIPDERRFSARPIC